MSESSVEKVTITVTNGGKHLKVLIPPGEEIDLWICLNAFVEDGYGFKDETAFNFTGSCFESTYLYKIREVVVARSRRQGKPLGISTIRDTPEKCPKDARIVLAKWTWRKKK